MEKRTWKFVGIHFAHMHMGDLLRQASEHPNAEIVGIFDPDREAMQGAIDALGIPEERAFTDFEACMAASQADVAILCSPTAEHADWVERIAAFDTHILVEKPFASNLAEADRMVRAMDGGSKTLMINWPLRWYPSHVTAKRLTDEGLIGEVKQVHYYDGNRGPLYHGADKIELEPTAARKASSWFYQKRHGGGSLLDYLGYGSTLGTWFHGGRAPIEVCAMTDLPEGIEVDEHSVTVARYATGLSKFETRWGTFTDPWTHQPQPKCGFVIVGSEGTISSYDFEPIVRVQTAAKPEGEDIAVDVLEGADANPIAYLIGRLEKGLAPDGPLGAEMARIGQQIVDTALRSAQEKRTLPLVD